MHASVRSASRRTFELVFVNQSCTSRTACVFQTESCVSMEDVRPLAWLVQGAMPTTEIAFAWRLEYGFSCSATGPLSAPGARFVPVQIWPADVASTNEVTLFCWRGSHVMMAQRRGPIPGALTIVVDGSVTPEEASVGIAVGGVPAYAIQAFPNTSMHLVPRIPRFHVTTGAIAAGDVLDERALASAAEIPFTEDLPAMRAILSGEGTWRIEPKR